MAIKKNETATGYPSAFGSHQSMVDENIELENYNFVMCVDAGGSYITEKWRLDNGLADPNRYAGRDSWNVGKTQ